jgi:glycosyltransferase involved in cell wall biosynthesis
MNPKITIIIPVWNGEKYVEQAIASVLQQDYDNKEVIVVNDGSTDGTEKIIQRFGKQISSLPQENRGLGASRNAAIQIATGSYLAFLDHDDLWTPSKLTEQMAALLASGQDPLVFSHVEQFLCPTLSAEEAKRIAIPQTILPGHIAGTLLISKSRFAQIGPFLEEKKLLGEFIEWYLRAVEKKIPILLLDTVAHHRRVHQDNMGRRNLSRRGDYLRILKAGLDRRRGLVPA